MKFLSSPAAIYVTNESVVLKCSKLSGKLYASKRYEVSSELDSAVEIGDVKGVVGSLCIDNEHFLLVITQCTPVATYSCSQHKIHHIDKVIAVPLEENAKIDKAELNSSSPQLNRIINSQKKLMKFVTDKVCSVRIIDQLLSMFNDNGDFYVCFGSDLTLTTQRLMSQSSTSYDERFFWNRRLLGDLFAEDGSVLKDAQPFITPICQGFVSERELTFESDCHLTLTIISRRSVKRAGLRYLRRGIDQEANVANFVETELILNIFSHYLSYVQIRGSVPVFWSQRGYRYRPPLVVDKPFNESFPVFEKHINSIIDHYGTPVTLVNLVDQTGRELDLAVSYLLHTLKLNSPHITYCSFDFHFHCRALRFDKVNDLISMLDEQLRETAFCWVDKSGQMVREQHGIVRTNCVDCLDRTNVVQCAVSQAVVLVQAQRLGLVGPLSSSPHQLIRTLQSLWADNGDAISRQYAGTDALKGDVTRSGQRKIVGMVRDGYTSASRYYLSHTRHAQRQIAIDTLLKEAANDSDENVSDGDEEESESIARLVSETIHFVLPETEVLVGGWALVSGSNSSDQIDTVLLLTRQRVIVAIYDDDSEKLVEVKVIDFEDVIRLQFGTFAKSPRMHLRLYARPNEQFTWRAAKTRLFNNVAIPLKCADEADEYIEAIGEQFRVTMAMSGHHIEIPFVGKLDGCSEKSGRRIMSMLASAFGANSTADSISTVNSSANCASSSNRIAHPLPSDEQLRDKIAASTNENCMLDNAKTNPIIVFSPEEGRSSKSIKSQSVLIDGVLSPEPDNSMSSSIKNTVDIFNNPPTLTANPFLQQQTCQVHTSKSDGRLSDKASGFVSKLQKLQLRLPTSKSQIAINATAISNNRSIDPTQLPIPAPNPFAQYKQQILTSKSRILLL